MASWDCPSAVSGWRRAPQLPVLSCPESSTAALPPKFPGNLPPAGGCGTCEFRLPWEGSASDKYGKLTSTVRFGKAGCRIACSGVGLALRSPSRSSIALRKAVCISGDHLQRGPQRPAWACIVPILGVQLKLIEAVYKLSTVAWAARAPPGVPGSMPVPVPRYRAAPGEFSEKVFILRHAHPHIITLSL